MYTCLSYSHSRELHHVHSWKFWNGKCPGFLGSGHPGNGSPEMDSLVWPQSSIKNSFLVQTIAAHHHFKSQLASVHCGQRFNPLSHQGRPSIDVIYPDFAKAFDKVLHRRLLAKVEGLGIHDKLLRWISSWLSDRSHTHTHTHNRFTARLEYVRVHPGEQVPER